MQERHSSFTNMEDLFIRKHAIYTLQVHILKFAMVTDNFNDKKVLLSLRGLKSKEVSFFLDYDDRTHKARFKN